MTTPSAELTTSVRVAAVTRIVIGSLLILLAVLAWRGGGTAADLARLHERSATLQPAMTGGEVSRWLAPVVSPIDRDIDRHAVIGSYWARDYRSLTDASPRASTAAAAMLTSANAAFRRAQMEAAGRPFSPERLDQVLQAYAGVLKNSGFDREAAYNYEYLARLRDAAARAKPGTTKLPSGDRTRQAGSVPARPGDLPAGPTIHGRPGTHPPATRGEEFEVLTPMDYGDRETQPEPTPGVKLPKKG